MRLLVVDNEEFQAALLRNVLHDAGFEVFIATTVDAAIDALRTQEFSLLMTDLRMPPGRAFSAVETKGGHETGIRLASVAVRLIPSIKVIVYTAGPTAGLGPWLLGASIIEVFDKPAHPREIIALVHQTITGKRRQPTIFIVHGRDSVLRLELEHFLQNELKLPKPIILAEQPGFGRTIMEQFEAYAKRVDLVFVLLSPDERGGLKTDSKKAARARQNVIFELGYFLGSLGRLSGRVIVLSKGNVEIPSDIAGIKYIDVTGGISASDPLIRAELADWL